MDQIYREYSEKYKHIMHYAGIMKKENGGFTSWQKELQDIQN